MTGTLVRMSGATIVVEIRSDGRNKVTGTWLQKVSGTETVNLYGEEIQADVTTLARINGGKCFNTNAAAGTLGQAGVVDCLGTATNSWHLRGNPTLVY